MRPEAIASAIAGLGRPMVEGVLEALIDQLDALDGDADAECDLIEDDPFEAHPYMGPGCPISDNDHGVDDLCHDGDEGI